METEALKLPGQDVRKLLAAANGDAALLYLYEQSGLPRAEAMERLRMTQTRYDLAAATLQQMGLWQEETKRFFAPAEAPHYTEEDVTREYHAGPEFPSMVGEAQRRLGRILSTEELKILLCIYRYLGLAPEVISILISAPFSLRPAQQLRSAPAASSPSVHPWLIPPVVKVRSIIHDSRQ